MSQKIRSGFLVYYLYECFGLHFIKKKSAPIQNSLTYWKEHEKFLGET